MWVPRPMVGKIALIEYRPFRNSDPPRLVKLWNACEMGRGAVHGITCDILDALVFAEPYWDSQGLIVAIDEGEVVGFVHAGFGPNESESALDFTTGVISMVMVHPKYYRQGIGRELVRRAEEYLRTKGAERFQAGESPERNPFYLGLYGGSNSPGFLESDPAADPFLKKLGYEPKRRILVFHKDIREKNDPFDVRMVAIRRAMELIVTDQPAHATWWWMTRQGRFDSIRFILRPKQGGAPVAELSCWGLDLFAMTWQERAVGFTHLIVSDNERKKGYGKTVVVEAIRRLREEMVTKVELQVEDDNQVIISLVESNKFQQADVGIIYEKA
ncbi:putative acetyltransferase [Symmachiella dynata]|nr:putative acetyltransferase [Symmachiella dynata]